MVNWKLEKKALMAQKTGSRHRHWLSSLSDQLCVWPPTVIGWRGETNSWDSFFYWVIGTFKLTFHSMICQIVS